MKTRNNNNCSLKYINKFKNHCKNQIKKKEKKRKIEISLPPTIFNFQNPTKLNKNSLEQFPRKLNPFARSSTYPPIDLQTFEPAKKTPWSSSFVNRRRHFPILFYSLLKHRSWNTVKRNPCVLWTRFPFRAHPRVHARYVAEENRGGWYRPFSSVFIMKIVYVAPFSMRFRTAAVRPFSSSSSLSRFLSPFLSHPSSTRFFSTRRLRVFRYGLNLIRRYRGSLYFYTKSSRRLRC